MLEMDGKIMHFMVRVADLIILHMVWLIFCIPVVTAGPATTAAYVVAGKIIRDEGTSVIMQFFEAFRTYFIKSLQAEFLLFALGILFLADCILMCRVIVLPAVLQTVVWGILIFIGLCCWIEISYIWLLIPASRGNVRELFYHAFAMAIANWRDTLQMFVENVALLTVFVISVAYIPQIAILYCIFGTPVFFLINARIIRNIQDRYS